MKIKKFKSLRDKFEEEYTATVEPCNNKRGFQIKYVYYGNWYLWNLPEEDLRREKRGILYLAALDVLLFFLAAALPSDVNGYAFVAFTGIVALLAVALKMLGVLQFLFAKYLTTKSNFEDAERRIRVWSIIQSVCTAVSSAGCIYYMIAFGFYPNRLVTMLLYALDTAVTILVLRRYIRIPHKVKANDVLEHVTRASLDI